MESSEISPGFVSTGWIRPAISSLRYGTEDIRTSTSVHYGVYFRTYVHTYCHLTNCATTGTFVWSEVRYRGTSTVQPQATLASLTSTSSSSSLLATTSPITAESWSSVIMASHQLAIAKLTLSAGLIRPDPSSVSKDEIAHFHALLDQTLARCSPTNVQV